MQNLSGFLFTIISIIIFLDTVLSTEDLEQTSGGGMIWLVDDYYWSWPYAYSIATDSSTIRTRMTGYGNGIIP